MSGYPDDRFDGPPAPNQRNLEAAQSAVQAPGVLLIVTGVLSLLSSVWGLIQLRTVPAQVDQALAQIEADPKIPNDQKESWREMCKTMKEVAEHPAAVVGYILGMISSVIVAVGGVKLMNLSGTAFPIVGSILAMIPCTVGCCCLGFSTGLWGLARAVSFGCESRHRRSPGGGDSDPDAEYLR
ncbi:MAG: hypothetical protein U0792_25215 [Gemmataceae bacterium]